MLINPKALLPRADLSVPEALRSLPLAVPLGGALRQAVDACAAKHAPKAAAVIHPAVECTSYLHASAALKSGGCAAVLPGLALSEFRSTATSGGHWLPSNWNATPFP